MEPEQLRICMVSDDFLPAATGVGVHLQTIIPLLAAKGHQVCVITSRRRGQPTQEQWQQARIYRLPSLSLYGFDQALPLGGRIGAILEENAVQLVHHHYLSLLLLRGFHVAAALGLPQVYTYHMTVDHLTQAPPLKPLRGFLSKIYVNYCNRFDQIMAPSAKLAEEIPALGIHSPVCFVSNPIVFSEPSGLPKPNDHLGFEILYAGRLDPEKNVPLLIRAFALLADKLPRAKLRIAGKGTEEAALHQLAARLGVGARVTFLGFVERSALAQHYSTCDVFVLPSLVETQGMVAMEAMHFGKPVIVTNRIVSARELVQEGVNGFIVDADSTEELAERLTQLHDDPARRRDMGLRGKEYSERYEPTRIIEQIEHVYLQALSGTTARPVIAHPPS